MLQHLQHLADQLDVAIVDGRWLRISAVQPDLLPRAYAASLTFWADPQRCEWVSRRDLDRVALPSVMRAKVPA